jgi:hypothetical protein
MNPPPLDSDILVFVATCTRVLMTAPARLRRQGLLIPEEYRLEEVPEQAFTEKQRQFFAPYDEKLAAMNYFPACSYRVANLARSLLRRYANPTDPAYCTVIAAEVKYYYKGEQQWAPISQTNFRTDFTNGRSLTTRNMNIKTVMDRLPEHDVQECPNVKDVAELKARHDKKAAKLGVAQPFPNHVEKIFEAIRADHRRFSEFQLERGIYERRSPGGYAVSRKAHWRGIRNHWNPFAQHVSLPRLAVAVLVATGIPTLTYLRVAPGLAPLWPRTSIELLVASQVVLLASYLLSGAVIGLLFKRSVFMWAFLLTYIGVHLCTGRWFSLLPFSGFAGSAAYSVKRLRQRQRVMLQPSSVR